MIQTIDLRGRRPSRRELVDSVPRAVVDVAVAAESAARLIAEVRADGEMALNAQAKRFDGGAAPRIRVEPSEIAAAVDTLDATVRASLEEAIARVRAASQAQLPAPAVTRLGEGAVVEQRWHPMNRVGLYVPGGKAVYPSSVVMNVVPAQVAGVPSIVVASPPQAEFDGRIHPVILGACGLLGIDQVYAMGGAGAIGAFAYGVDGLLDPVDLITGPGNVYVAAAKRLVRGDVGIDAEAGPTEILIIADAGADARLVAADLISQAEHDELAAAVLVTDAPDLVAAVRSELAGLVAETLHAERVATALGGPQSALVLVDDLHIAAELSNVYGPEHLEIQTTDPDAVLAEIDHAGAIFLGPHSPVSLGDYLAGSNHVLPTGGQARFGAGLGVASFLRSQQLVRYEREGLAAVAPLIRSLSDAEHLPAHGDAVDRRFSR